MPGNVSTATPTTVLPLSLSTAFARSRAFRAKINEYVNGESQRSVEATVSRSRWELSKRLTASQHADLKAFYLARHGAMEPFYFYDVYETVPAFTYDDTGQTVTGRYIVRFEGAWSDSVGLGRAEVSVALLEIA